MAIKEMVEVQRLGSCQALIMQWISQYEEHPSPADSCGVDYSSIYSYIAALLEVSDCLLFVFFFLFLFFCKCIVMV